MMKRVLLLLIFVHSVYADDFSPQLLINTSCLGQIQGELNPKVRNVRQFIGIPFAQPPIGSLRFLPPSPLPPFNGSSSDIYNATAAAHQGGFPKFTCMQYSSANGIIGQEDCLYLDIHLPLNIDNGTLLPVVIYIYGGGFQTSSSQNPTDLVSTYQNVIYVAIRYRINVFGFIATTILSEIRPGPVQSSGLHGFEDQQLAIKWVRDNIQVFGGNPNEITLQGHSAGGVSVCLHLVAPDSRNLFQRAIIESGGCDIAHQSLSQMETIGDEIFSHFCVLPSHPLECLQGINASELIEYVKKQDYMNFFYPNSLYPLVDGLIIPDSITKLFQNGQFATNISLLTGTVNGEFGFFIGSNAEPGWRVENLTQSVLSKWVQLYSNGQSAYLNKTFNPYVDRSVPPELNNYYGLNDALSTYRYQCPVRRVASHLIHHSNQSAYLYSFNYVPLSSRFAYLSQAVHGQELPFVFNSVNHDHVGESVLASAMSLLWMRFVIHGNPNIPLATETKNRLIEQLSSLGSWPKYSPENPSSYIIFSNEKLGNSSATIQLSESRYHTPLCEAWDEIVPNPNITKKCNPGYTGPNCTKGYLFS